MYNNACTCTREREREIERERGGGGGTEFASCNAMYYVHVLCVAKLINSLDGWRCWRITLICVIFAFTPSLLSWTLIMNLTWSHIRALFASLAFWVTRWAWFLLFVLGQDLTKVWIHLSCCRRRAWLESTTTKVWTLDGTKYLSCIENNILYQHTTQESGGGVHTLMHIGIEWT